MVMLLGGSEGVQTKAPGMVPQPVAKEILKKATEDSVVQKLAGKMPMPITGAAVAVQTGHVEAGVVGEGQKKPVSKQSYKSAFLRPVKVATIVAVSKELRMTNPTGLLENIKEDLAGAITRAFDLAILHGRDAKTGQQIDSVEYVNKTTKRVELGTTTKENGGITGDLLAGHDLVINGEQVHDDFTGFALDKTVRSKLVGATDTLGRPVFQQSVNLADRMDSVLGLPAAYGKAVSGRIGASEDTKVRGFGGDWGALKYGFAEQMTLRSTDVATLDDGGQTVHLWQQNMEAYLVEAIFGWVISDVASFVAYEDKS